MAAPRSSSFRILRALKSDIQPIQKRPLHITGAQHSPAFSPTSSVDYQASLHRFNLTDLKNECQIRRINSSGTKHELVERIGGYDAMQSRAFSIAMKKVVREQRGPFGGNSPVEKIPTRHFNTSRTLKSVGDSSTIDFAYLPSLEPDLEYPPAQSMRVPILPHNESPQASHPMSIIHSNDTPLAADPPVMKAEIYTVSEPEEPAAAPSAMHEVVDNHAVEIDPYKLTETVASAAKKVGEKIEEEMGVPVRESGDGLRRVWGGFLDDLLGSDKGKKVV